MAKKADNHAELNPNADVQTLLELLKGMPSEAVAVITKQIQTQAESIKARAEQQAKLNAAKSAIESAILPVARDVPDFDVHVRKGEVEVKLIGVGGRGGTGSPKATPVRDSGMSMKQLVATYLPDKLAEFEACDPKTGQGRGIQYKLAKEALAVRGQA